MHRKREGQNSVWYLLPLLLKLLHTPVPSQHNNDVAKFQAVVLRDALDIKLI